MSDLHLVWEGPTSDHYILTFNRMFRAIDPSLSEDETYNLAQSLEMNVRNLIMDEPNVIEIDDQLYYQGFLRDFRLRLPIRSGDEPIFPEPFLISENLPSSDNIVGFILKIINGLIESALRVKLNSEIYEDWLSKEYVLFLNKELVISENFEKSLLGIFFYMIYLREYFRDNPNVCVMISELQPLINRLASLESDLTTLSPEQFTAKNPAYADDYLSMITKYRQEKTHNFRFFLLETILLRAGPYLLTVKDRDTGRHTARMTRSFETLFNRCQAGNTRYTVAFVVLMIPETAHANILIIDNQERIIERFDPNGAIITGSVPGYEAVNIAMDQLLDNFAKKRGYLYVSPEVFCPRFGVQAIESQFSGKIGYCVSWSILYAEERLRSYRPRTWVSSNLLMEIIRKYNLQGTTPQETSANIERWIAQRITKIFEDMNQLFTTLSEALGLNVKYVDGKLIYLE